MRILATIPHPKFRIVAYTLDSHYYIEIEAGPMKQCYKLPKSKAENLGDIQKWLDDSLLEEVNSHFEKMYLSHKGSIDRNL